MSDYADLLSSISAGDTDAAAGMGNAEAGLLEVPLSMAWNTGAQAAALGAQATARYAGMSAADSSAAGQKAQSLLSYEPRTQWGSKALDLLGRAFEGAANSAPVRAVADPISSSLLSNGVQPGDLAGMTAAAGLLAGPEEMWKAAPEARMEALPEAAKLTTGDSVPIGPNIAARRVASTYMGDRGAEYSPPGAYAPEVEGLGQRTADAFDAMEHNPDDPQTKAAYDALIDETLQQYQYLKKAGLKVERMTPDVSADYKANPRLSVEDINNNNHMFYFPSDEGFGEEGAEYPGHPLLRATDEVDANGKPMLANDVFRVVHDYFGHAKEGVGFGPRGEYNAFLQHSSMYSPVARRAMATETHGQNSFVNYGPDAAHNAGADVFTTKYAPQKAGLLPDELTNPPSPEDTSFDSGAFERQASGAQTVADPKRNAFPGIYGNPREIVSDANVAPEDPILHQLFGVTRKDLSDASMAREGNLPGTLPGAAANPKGSKAAAGVMTAANTGRLVDLLQAARERPDLFHGMTGWYNMDPLYSAVEKEVGKDAAPAAYSRLNTLVGMASPGSDVMTEINRGTAAHMMASQGRFEDFARYGGQAVGARTKNFPADLLNVMGHPYHSTAQAIPMRQYLQSGEVQMQSPKVPLYIQASGVPETGFQTNTPVGDSHWSRGVGLADTRTNQGFAGSVTNPEMSQLAPWYRDQVAAKAGLLAVPAQALQWGALGAKTGVDTAIGAPKLELFAQQVRKAAVRAGVSPKEMLGRIIRGQAHAGALAGTAVGAGLLAKEGQDDE